MVRAGRLLYTLKVNMRVEDEKYRTVIDKIHE